MGGYGRGARSSYTDFNNGRLEVGNVQYGNVAKGFGTGDLQSMGYQGPPPQVKRVSSNAMNNNNGQMRGMDMGYSDQMSNNKQGQNGYGKMD